MQDLFHSKITLGCIHYVSYRGGAEDFRGGSQIFRAKKGGYENCLNISWGDAYFFVIFCLAFVIVLKSGKRNDKQGL